MKKIQTLLAVAALTSTTAFASVLEVDFTNGANWNSAVTGGMKLIGGGATDVITLGASASATDDIELNVGRANISAAGLVGSGKHLILDSSVQLNVTAAITPDPIRMDGDATINNAANAIVLDELAGTGLATMSGVGVVTLEDLSANSGGVALVNAAVTANTQYPGADSSSSGVVAASAAPAAASLFDLTFNEIDATYNVGVNDFIDASATGKVLKATKISIGGHSWAAAVTAN